jgi:response regulator RpfG family c-di-GMP phosphodiesterase
LEYRTRLCSKIGQKRFDELEAKRHVTKKWTKDELKEIIKKYKDLVRDMK